MAKPSNYWDKRAIKRLSEAEKQSEAYIERINKMYDQAQRNIQRDIENIYENYSKATGLDTQSLKALLTRSRSAKLWEDMKRKGLDKYVKDNYKARITRLEQLQAQIYAKAKQVYTQERKAHTELYKRIVEDSYYKNIYDAQMGTGYDFGFSQLDENMVNALLNEKWSGKNYSQRIWGNTDLLAESLSEIVGGAMLSGQSIAKTSRQIRERFDVAKYYADRLVRTETNHFNNEADAMAYEEMNVDKYVFLATLDTRTSTICQEMDNAVIPLKEREVGKNYPPMHPNCRSKTRVYMGEEVEKTLKRRARDPITGKTKGIDNISYKEWAEQNGITTFYDDKDQKPQNSLKKQEKSVKITNASSQTQKAKIAREAERAQKHAKRVSFKGATNAENLKIANNTLEQLKAKYPTKELDEISIGRISKGKASSNFRSLKIDRNFINSTPKRYNWAKTVENNKNEIEVLWNKLLNNKGTDRADILETIADLERESKFKRWSVSSSGYGIQGTITHEYGHILSDQRIGLRNGKSAIASYNIDNETKYKKLREKVVNTFKTARRNGDIFNISLYAERNEREFFSEVFAMRELGEPLPDYIAEMITEVINV